MSTIAPQLWVDAEPMQGGPGEHVVDVKIEENFGREVRTATLIWNADLIDSIEREIIQEGKTEFAEFNTASYSAPKLGGTVIIRGTSNSKNLFFTIKNLNGAQINSSYLVGGIVTGNGENIKLDPGRYGKYGFEIHVKIPANNTGETVSRRLDVYGAPIEGSNIRPIIPLNSCVIITPVNDYYLTVDKTTAKIPASGGITTIKVDSNTNWEIVIKG